MSQFRHPDDEYDTNCEPLTPAEKDAVTVEVRRELQKTYCVFPECEKPCSGCEDFEIALDKKLRERGVTR